MSLLNPSSYADVVDAVIADMRTNVFQEITERNVRRYAQFPIEVMENDNEKHIGCWVSASGAEAARPLSMGVFGGSAMLDQLYELVYWEPSPTEEQQEQRMDPDAAKRLLALSEAVKARFFDSDTLHLGGAFSVAYQSLAAWGLGRGVRFIAWTFVATRPISSTP